MVANEDLGMPGQLIWICLGSNIQSAWGNSLTTLSEAIDKIKRLGLQLVCSSPVYLTPPLGSVRQPPYFNKVIAVRGSIASAGLLRALKKLEVCAGRRELGRWKPRPLDLDILDHGGRVVGRHRGQRVRGRCVLPHPEMHVRAFVLLPLALAAPHWHHPRLGASARQLLARLPAGAAHGVRRVREGETMSPRCRANLIPADIRAIPPRWR